MERHELLTVEEFAGRLHVTPACIRRWVLERKVSTVKLGRLVRIPAGEVRRLIDEGLRPARTGEEEHAPSRD